MNIHIYEMPYLIISKFSSKSFKEYTKSFSSYTIMSSKLWSVKCQEDSCFYIYVTWRVGFSTLWDPQWQQVASSGWPIFPVCYTVGSSDMSQDPVPFRKYFRRDSGTDKLEILLLHTYIFLVLLPTLPDASHHIKTVLKYVPCRKKLYLYLHISRVVFGGKRKSFQVALFHFSKALCTYTTKKWMISQPSIIHIQNKPLV